MADPQADTIAKIGIQAAELSAIAAAMVAKAAKKPVGHERDTELNMAELINKQAMATIQVYQNLFGLVTSALQHLDDQMQAMNRELAELSATVDPQGE